MIDGIQFVHCAIPDLALKDTDTKYKLNEGVTLPHPIAVNAASEESALELSRSISDTPIAFDKSIFINGKLSCSLKSSYLVGVRDGVEAAKAIRLDSKAIPCMDASEAQDLDIWITQLRIAMFLTNSANLHELGNAPIYKMK